jgi:hypothetical protein
MTERAVGVDPAEFARQVRQTRRSLDTIDDTSLVDLTHLAADAVRQLKQELAEIFPASNLPAFLLQGLIQLDDRAIKQDRVIADLRVLFRGSKQIGLYSTFFAAPALVLYGYQRLLALAGKDIDSAFPDGPWQFYTQFGLREDAARHCVETTGFGRVAAAVSEIDAATCWVYAAMCTLFGYDALLANEWEERILPRVLDAVLEESAATLPGKLPRKSAERQQMLAERVAELRRRYQLGDLVADWAKRRPYSIPPPGLPFDKRRPSVPNGTNRPHESDASLDDYPAYRRACFREYWAEATKHLPPDLHVELNRRAAARRATDLPAYQQQLTLLMTLRAETYQEHRTPLPTHMLQVALIAGGRYHLIGVCARDAEGRLLIFPIDAGADSPGVPLPLTRAADGGLRDRYDRVVEIDRAGRVRAGGDLLGRLRPPPIAQVKGQVAAALRHAQARGGSVEGPPDTDLLLAQALRERQRALRGQLGDAAQADLTALRYAPIIINWDQHDGAQPLTELRRTRRGCGDHALTLVRTDRSIVFDMSHIFFDALWGMALAEIMTGCATALLPLVARAKTARIAAEMLSLTPTPAFRATARAAAADSPVEVSAENDTVNLRALSTLRRRMVKIELDLTVNDLLLLARCDHAATYWPGAEAEQALELIAASAGGGPITQQYRRHLEQQRAINPALLIPMDASANDPRLRLYPTTFRNPRPGLLPGLERCDSLLARLRRYADAATRQEFERERQELYLELRSYAALLRALKQVTMRGESFTTAALRLMAHLPGAMQSLVDLIPQKIGILNEIIKGHEVFSNAGQVAATSSITRFASSRDDGDTKLLVWGVMSDADGTLVLTLRDFRPYVAPLLRLGRADLARVLAQDYLDTYAACVDSLAQRIQRVLAYKIEN